MSYSYDRRTKVAVKLEVHDKWRAIVEKHAKAEEEDLKDLLRDLVKYMKSEGMDLDLKRSWLGKTYAGSDGIRRAGELYFSESPSNVVQANERTIQKWVEEATGMWGGFVRKVGEGPALRQVDDKPVNVWYIDVGEY